MIQFFHYIICILYDASAPSSRVGTKNIFVSLLLDQRPETSLQADERSETSDLALQQ